jgi:hypothetical protein
MFPLKTKQSRGKLLPHSDLQGGECFLEETSHGKSCKRKDYKQKQKEHHRFTTGMWNTGTLNQRETQEFEEGDAEDCSVCSSCQ